MAFELGTVTAVAAPSTSTTPVPEEEEFYSSWSLFLVCMLLVLSLWTSYYLQIKRIRAVHETLVSILAGMAVGLIVRLSPGTMIREMLTFKHTLFFNLLLPPIILNSGYELKQENFFRNFGSILTFAFLGTCISAIGVGVLVYIYSFLGLESLDLTLIECLTFGSTLSATDPVTILAIFNQYKVDPKLYTVIFGESLLNDAVSIVMYETLTQFHGTEEVYISHIFHGIGIFLLSFSVSMALGVLFGLAMSLLLKHSALMRYPSIESCLVALCAYTCYFFSNGLSMSGIVSLLFCGITLKHYAYHTMSRRTQRASKALFSTLAQLSENFIFIYLGMALFTSAPTTEPVGTYVKPLFITITTVAVVFTRYAAVFPLSEALNFVYRHVRGQRTEELPHTYQMMLFWAGLRGAVGVALAAGFKGKNGQMLRTTVLVVVVLTVVVFGGTTARMLEVLGIRTGVEDEAASSDDDDDPRTGVWLGREEAPGMWRRDSSGARWQRYVDDEPSYLANSQSFPRGGAAAARIGTHYGYNHQPSQLPSPVPDSPFGDRGSFHDLGVLGGTRAPPPSGDMYGTDTYGSETPLMEPSPRSSESFDSDMGELPPADASRPAEDGRWFQAIDQRYLLPLFSNATASRTFHARRARRTSGLAGASANASSVALPGEEEIDLTQEVELVGGQRQRDSMITPRAGENTAIAGGRIDESRQERGLPSPSLRNPTFTPGSPS